MTFYAPQNLPSDTRAFSAKPIDKAFDEFATWSIGVGDYTSGHHNIKNNGLIPATKIRAGSLSKVWRSEASGANAYMLWYPGSAGTVGLSPVGGDEYRYGEYDIPGASVNFYLREALGQHRVFFDTSVHLWKARESNFFEPINNIATARFQLKLKGYLDGDEIHMGTPGEPDAFVKYEIDPTASTHANSFSRRGFGLNFWGANRFNLSKGLHTYKVTLTFEIDRTLTGGAAGSDHWLFNHIKGGAPKSSVTAIYR